MNIKITDIGMNGEGIGREGGKVYFVRGALPGEEAEVRVLEEKKNFAKAEAVEILKASGDRVKAPCPYFGQCGGCDIQHIRYEKQLEFKSALVKNTIKKIAGIDAEVQKTVASNSKLTYRNKSVFPVFEVDGRTKLGMFKAESHDTLEIKECKLAKAGINKVLALTADFLKDRKAGGLKYLVVREIGGESLITLVAEEEPTYLSEYVEMLKNNLQNFSVNLNISKSDKTILSNDFVSVFGKDYIESREFGIKQKTNSASFMQVNDDVKKSLYSAVLAEIGEDETVVDAYCGAGLLSAILAKRAKFVYGIEIVKPAIESAKQMAQENGIQNIKFVCGDCARELPKVLNKIHGEHSVILDPPRKGCDKRVIENVINSQPQKIIYISCSPISLAQNLKCLCAGGYTIKLLQPFDMFPQTANVETLCVLEKIAKNASKK